MNWTAIVAYVVEQAYTVSRANEQRQNLIVLASTRGGSRQLGGSRYFANVPASGTADVFDYRDVEIDGTNLGGLTIEARVEVRTGNAATSITPKIRNVTDGTDVVVGVACTATNADYSGAAMKQNLTMVLATGVKKYRLQYTTNNGSNPVFAHGEILIYANA